MSASYFYTRWIAWTLVLLGTIVKSIYSQGFTAICYLLGCHILKKTFLFVSPQGVPTIFEDELEDELELPSAMG